MNEHLLAAIMASSTDVIIAKTCDDLIFAWSTSATRALGYDSQEVVGRPMSVLIPQERRGLEQPVSAIPVEPFQTRRFDIVRRHKSGTLVPMCVTAVPMQMQGRTVGTCEFGRLATADPGALVPEGHFVADVSHEFRTPLNAIIGFAKLIRMSSPVADASRIMCFAGGIASAGEHLLRLVNDLLDLSRADCGKLTFRPEPIDLKALAGEVQAVLQPAAAQKSIRFALHSDPALDDVVLDPVRVRQVLYNYMSNALRVTPAHGVVSVTCAPEGEWHVRIEVADTGRGIAAADLPGLFTEFHQLRPARDLGNGGAGLGLWLTRRLVEAQGGSVGVRSTLGQGAVFYAILPRCAHGTTARPVPRPAPMQRRSSAKTP